MSRPSLDAPRGARYLMPAVPATVGARYVASSRVMRESGDRAYLAAVLATGFRSGASDAHHAARRAGAALPDVTPELASMLALRRCALLAVEAAAATLRPERRDAIVALAVEVQQRLVALPLEARAVVGVALVRDLLDDAHDRYADLDRAVRDAARAHHHGAAPAEAVATLHRMIATARTT